MKEEEKELEVVEEGNEKESKEKREGRLSKERE